MRLWAQVVMLLQLRVSGAAAWWQSEIFANSAHSGYERLWGSRHISHLASVISASSPPSAEVAWVAFPAIASRPGCARNSSISSSCRRRAAKSLSQAILESLAATAGAAVALESASAAAAAFATSTLPSGSSGCGATVGTESSTDSAVVEAVVAAVGCATSLACSSSLRKLSRWSTSSATVASCQLRKSRASVHWKELTTAGSPDSHISSSAASCLRVELRK
mmetsp:Transcript_114006/g.368328  ORF Transcript_114006/g.368328 Transcript_114006/m.368328 type:complete len:222 (-) Transcript_114006:217-882(-)